MSPVTSPSKSSSGKKSTANTTTTATTTTTQPPWTDLMKNRNKPYRDNVDEKPYRDNVDDENAPSHSLPLPEEARTTAAVADAANNSGKSSMTKRRIMVIMGTVLAVVLIVSFSIAISAKRKDEDNGSSSVASSKKMPDGTDEFGGTVASGVRDPDLDVGQNERLRSMVTFLGVYSHPNDLETLDTPQNKAVKWLSDEDEMQMALPVTSHYKDAYPFVQRYILAVLYYSTNGDEWKHSLDFMTSSSVCEWNSQREITITATKTGEIVQTVTRIVGIQCDDDNQVNYIYLPQNNLVGTLPVNELGLLEAMDHFSIVQNNIQGPLPDSLKLWTDIRILSVESNNMSGPLPSYLSTFTNLEYIHLGNNQFSGPIPTDIASLTSLFEFSAFDNQLSGPIDMFYNMNTLLKLDLKNNKFTGKLTNDSFLNANDLETLDLGGNQLSGTIPGHFYMFTTVSLRQNQFTGSLPIIDDPDYTIEFLSVYGNALTGELPDSLGNLQQLTHLDVSRNAITGRIPSDQLNKLDNLIYLYVGDNQYEQHHFPYMYSLSNLQELSIRNSNLIGEIPDWVGTSFTSLQLLDASHNHFNDTIPFELGNVETLRFLMLDHNQFAGMVPTSFADLQHLHVLTLSQNALIGGMSRICDEDMGPPYLDFLVVDCQVHSCDCCNYCCAQGDTTCLTGSYSPNVNNTYQRDIFVFPDGLMYNPHQLKPPASDDEVTDDEVTDDEENDDEETDDEETD